MNYHMYVSLQRIPVAERIDPKVIARYHDQSGIRNFVKVPMRAAPIKTPVEGVEGVEGVRGG